MDNVPALFIKSVLCITSLPDVQWFQVLSSRSWSQLAGDQMKRRKNWRLFIDNTDNEHLGYLESKYKYPSVFASFDEFAVADPDLNQITEIWFITPNKMFVRKDGDDDKIASKWTKIAAQDIESFKRRFFSRINYGALDRLELAGTDSIGLRLDILNHLADKNLRIRKLELSYQGPASIDFLKEQVQKKVIVDMSMYGDWPQKSTAPLVEALIPQRQLLSFSCYARMSLRESFFTSLVADWKNDDSPEEKSVHFWRQTVHSLRSGVYDHPTSEQQLKLEVDTNNNFITLIQSEFLKR
uniref:F-box domain-containing protein n=1 Tax=Steinernema glaseri TaxID=37863 RepID=A0A1I7Z079_9BILA